MKSLKFLFVFVLLIFPNFFFAQTYELVWSDEFDYTGLPDDEKWGYDTDGNAWNWGNNELQFYTNSRQENAWVENDILTITARKEQMGGKNYTSARLITKGKGDWLYGKIEVNAKLPGGTGTWPAIWMLPTDWEYGDWPSSGEIDIMEYVGSNPGVVHGTVHTKAYNHTLGTQKGAQISVSDAESAFHVYSMEWTPDEIEVFVDGTKYFTFPAHGDYTTWPFDKRFHLLLNVAIGGSWGGVQGVDDAIFPVKMEVDYVRVYQDKTTSISKVEDVENITISPNPVSDFISISSEKEFNYIEIFTLNGQKNGSYNFSGTKSKEINVSGLKPGVYFLSIKNKNGEMISQNKFLKK